MDWDAAIEKNREALKRILAMIVAMAGLDSRDFRGQFTLFRQKGAAASRPAWAEKSKLSPALSPELTLPRRLHRAVLRLLRPAEAAVRRLIVVAARGLVVTLPPPWQKPQPKFRPGAGPVRMPVRAKARARRDSLPLLDALRPWNRRSGRPQTGGVPRISCPGYSEPFRILPWSPNDPIDAARLDSRLRALVLALDDLPGQARRFARWRARRDAAIAQEREAGGARRFHRMSPLKPGWPPGWRRKPQHEVHEVLDVVHGLARWALEPPDTS